MNVLGNRFGADPRDRFTLTKKDTTHLVQWKLSPVRIDAKGGRLVSDKGWRRDGIRISLDWRSLEQKPIRPICVIAIVPIVLA